MTYRINPTRNVLSRQQLPCIAVLATASLALGGAALLAKPPLTQDPSEERECSSLAVSALLSSVSSSSGFWLARLRNSTYSNLTDDLDLSNTYESDDLGFTLQYPASWRLELRENTVGRSLVFWKPDSSVSRYERDVLWMNITTVDPASAEMNYPSQAALPPVLMEPSSQLGLLFHQNARLYGLSSTFSTFPERDATEIVATIRSLRFTCPGDLPH